MLSSSEVIQLSIYTDKYLYNLYFPFTFQTTLRYDDIKYDYATDPVVPEPDTEEDTSE